jgi:hypothetical protein
VPNLAPGRRLAQSALLLAAAILIVCRIYDSDVALGTYTAGGNILLNSDSLLPAQFIWDVMHHVHAWAGFQLPRVPSLFPDLLVEGAVQFITGSWRIGYLSYAVFLLALLAAAAGLVIDAVLRCGAMAGSLIFLCVAIPVLAIELTTPALFILHINTFSLATHGGQLSLSILLLYLLWRHCNSPSLAHRLLVFGIGTAAVLSDRLSFVTYVVPAIAGIAYANWRGMLSRRGAAWALVAVVASAVAGWMLLAAFHTQPAPAIEPRPWRHLVTFLAELRLLLAKEPLAWLVAVVPLLSLVVAKPGIRLRAGGAAGFCWVVAVTATVASIGATALLYNDMPSYRYAGAALWWPVIMTSLALARLLGRRIDQAGTAAIGALVLALGIASAWTGSMPPRLMYWRNVLTECLMQARSTAGLQSGLAEYWFARPIAAGSDWTLHVDQVTPDGRARYWGNDRFSFIDDDGHGPPVYNFIVMAGMDRRIVSDRYGPPARTIACNGADVWVYDDPSKVRETLVRNSPDLRATFELVR